MAWEQIVLAAAAVVTVALAAVKMYWEMRKDRRTTKQMLDHIATLRTNVEGNHKEIEKLRAAYEGRLTLASESALKQRQLALKEAELQMKKEQQEWKKLVQIARGIGWYLERTKEE